MNRAEQSAGIGIRSDIEAGEAVGLADVLARSRSTIDGLSETDEG